MPHKHPQTRQLQKFLRGEASPDELRDLVFHLLETCPDCATAAATEADGDLSRLRLKVGSLPAEVLVDRSGDALFRRVESRVQPAIDLVRRQRTEAIRLLAELQPHPIERQRILLQNTPRFHTLPLADLLLEAAWNRGLEEPAAASEMVGLVLDLLDHVVPAAFGEGMLNDFRGRAWAYRANFLRIQSALRESDEAFRTAEEFLSEGTGDPLETARLLGLKATLRRLQLRLDEASEMLDESLGIYQALGEDHLAGRTMVTQALLIHEQGDAAGALEVLRRAQDLIEPDRDAYLMRVVQQNSVTYLMELGHYEEAMTLVPALRRRMVDGGSRMELLRLRWQEGRLLLGLGHDSRAEAAFLEVRKGFVEQGIAHDAASVSLELAGLYLRQGRTAEIRDLARQLVPIFQSRDLHQEAIAALLLFQRAVEMDTLTLRMVEEISEVVRRTQQKLPPKDQEPS